MEQDKSDIQHNNNKIDVAKLGFVVNAAFLFFETSKLWALIMYIL